jgi:hypothetical protein
MKWCGDYYIGRRRGLIAGFLACYLMAGTMIGMALKYATPPTNAFGVAYIAAIWPIWIGQIWTGWNVPVPSQSFTFKEH